MSRCNIALLFAISAISWAQPALAEGNAAARHPEAASADTAWGYRTQSSPSGFRLVDHGVWRDPEPDASQLGGTSTDARFVPRPSPNEVAAPSGFRRAAYLPHVYAAEARYALPTGLLDALLWTESRYNPFAVSKAGAAGLGQLMPATAKELGVSNRFDPLANLAGAARYLRQMIDRFGNVPLALAAYNAGPGAVEKAGGVPLNGETPAYVRGVLRRWRI